MVDENQIKNDSPIIHEVRIDKEDLYQMFRLAVPLTVQHNLISKPLSKDEEVQGLKMLDVLEERGAFLHDSKDSEGKLVPAEQWFDSDTGKETYRCHWQNGKGHDPADGVPAEQVFDSDTGKEIYRCYLQNGNINDPVNGVPAAQWFDTSGKVIGARSFKNGRRQKKYSQDDIYQLNQNRGKAGLPRSILVRKELTPV